MTYSVPSKKMLILNILDILKRYSDENHRLSQKEIVEILEREYSTKVDRKTVKRNLMKLIDCGYDLEYTETTRKNRSGEDETIFSDWYLNRDFTDAELRLLIDGLLFSKHIPYSQCKQLVEKIAGMSNVHFRAKVKHIRNMPEKLPVNQQLFLTIEVLDEAISRGKQAAFHYNRYDADMKLHRTRDEKYNVSPYQIVATNGRYYLICNTGPHENISHYRLDRITDIRVTDAPARPLRSLPEYRNGLDLPQHMAEHIYMFSGASAQVTFRAGRGIVGDILDWFGMDVVFSEVTEEAVTATVKVNEQAMFYWAMQYGEHVEVVEPLGLRNKMIQAFESAFTRYNAEQKND